MDDLIALLDTTNEREEGIEIGKRKETTNTSHQTIDTRFNKKRKNNTVSTVSDIAENKSSTCAPVVDPHTNNIRIIPRYISRAEMVDILSPFSFFSPSQLACMSKASLANILCRPQDTKTSSDVISGRTNMASVGLIFSNSGTMISRTGAAFSIITVGTLGAGPAMSVLLFGDVYAKFCKCKVGSVVALLGASLMPPREKDNANYFHNTMISFSVNDLKQMLLVGMARDFAICAGKCFKKRNGKIEEMRCKSYVDLRKGKFCKDHNIQNMNPRNQHNKLLGNLKDGRGVLNNVNQEKFLIERGGNIGNLVQVKPTIHKETIQNINRNSQFSSMLTKVMYKSAVIGDSNKLRKSVEKSKEPNKKIRAPLHMIATPRKGKAIRSDKKNCKSLCTDHSSKSQESSKLNNSQFSKIATASNLFQIGKEKFSSDKKPRFEGKNKNLRKVATFGGYDGEVQIPKANPLFHHANPPRESHISSQLGHTTFDEKAKGVGSNQHNRMLDKQRALANQFRQMTKNPSMQGFVQTSKQYNARKKMDLTNHRKPEFLFGFSGSQKFDESKILRAKSRFASEADAESLVRSHAAVIALGKKEKAHKKSNKSTKILDNDQGPIIITEWICKTCKRTFRSEKNKTFKPISCVNAGHDLKKN
mmetsp:Transcript_10573/g.14915  ORF Transcript_10573/g.14915 Transcript_10573/m.14915 type:complete len:646 (+) Transcript_10573:40-1977(+)